MRPDETLVAQPVRSLQTMLRVLSEHDRSYPAVIPDGIYGQNTMQAVSIFQSLHGLPVTGVADQATWERIAAEYEKALIHIAEAEPVQIILNPNQVLRRGEASPYLRVAQAMLYTLAEVYSSIPLPSQSGILDVLTSDSIASFQQLTGLPMTGELDKVTWKHIALHFPLAANLGKGSTQAQGLR